MNGIYFKNVLIADVEKKTAKYQEFHPGTNVITSDQNHVGKSSLVKSLYYAMGAEVEFDEIWGKTTKLTIVEFCLKDKTYKIARMHKTFALFCENELILLTNRVSRELAAKFEEIFEFAVYLPEKKSKNTIMAPPVFSFLPYYIDQDDGWTGLYESFENLDQFKKEDREKSLYYHLNIYNKHTIDLFSEKDRLREEQQILKQEEERLRITLEALTDEIHHLIPAKDISELESNLSTPKKKIETLVKKLGAVRNRIQTLETTIQRHEYQLNVIKEYRCIKEDICDEHANELNICPNCGYSFNEEIYRMVRDNYCLTNEDYVCQQIQLIIDSIKRDLDKNKDEYVKLMNKLDEQEAVYAESNDLFEVYIKQRGLKDSISEFTDKLDANIITQKEYEKEIKEINKQLREMPEKEDIEEKYVDFVRSNLIKLDAWNATYDNSIKIIKPMKAQGTLEIKIILAQVIGFFQTLNYFNCPAIRFPFVIDSPRSKEPSFDSSKAILEMILEMDYLPQIILATMDFEEFNLEESRQIHKVILSDKKALLNKKDYQIYEEEISDIYELIVNS